MKSLSFGSLWPDFSALFDYLIALSDGKDPALTGDVISAGFVAGLGLIILYFGHKLLFGRIKAKREIKTLETIVDVIDVNRFPATRAEAGEKAKQSGKTGKLWKEFDETLVEITSVTQEGSKIRNTVDAHHFFNSHTLAPELIENRLLAAVPGILTAMGVIGTFVGLQMGLSSVSFSGEVEQQQEDIQRVIASATVAFLTSVWGVGASVIFNAIEKRVEQGIKKDIRSLQETIDFLFPKIIPEQFLVNIESSSRSAQDALGGLAEQIGMQLQQAVATMGEQVTERISEALMPAIGKLAQTSSDLADKQAVGATDALAKVVSQFQEKISEAGVRQRQLMEEATTGLANSVADWQERMNEFLGRLEQQESHRHNYEKELMEKMLNTSEGFMQQTSKTVADQARISEDSLERGAQITRDVKNLTTGMDNVIEQLASFSEKTSDISANLEQAGNQVRSATATLETGIKDAVNAVADLSRKNSAVVDQTSEVLNGLNSIKGELTSTAGSVSEAAELASESFKTMTNDQTQFVNKLKESLEQYESSMKKEFESLTGKVRDSLEDYSVRMSDVLKGYSAMVQEQTNARLNEWNKQTQDYTKTMDSAVKALDSVVSEIQDKLNRD